MKLHAGCGTVYLKGYVNIDAAPHRLAQKSPGLVVDNGTTFDNYYKNEFGKGTGLVVADKVAKIQDLPFDDGAFDEVVMLHVLEHFPSYEVGKVLGEIRRVLEPGGAFIVGVPNILGTAEQLLAAKTVKEEMWCLRLIEGAQRNEWSHHYCSYTPRRLESLLQKYGFVDIEAMPNINFYPAIHRKCYKAD